MGVVLRLRRRRGEGGWHEVGEEEFVRCYDSFKPIVLR